MGYKTPRASLQMALTNTSNPLWRWDYHLPRVCTFRNQSSARVLAFAFASPWILGIMQMPARTTAIALIFALNETRPVLPVRTMVDGSLHPHRKLLWPEATSRGDSDNNRSVEARPIESTRPGGNDFVVCCFVEWNGGPVLWMYSVGSIFHRGERGFPFPVTSEAKRLRSISIFRTSHVFPYCRAQVWESSHDGWPGPPDGACRVRRRHPVVGLLIYDIVSLGHLVTIGLDKYVGSICNNK